MATESTSRDPNLYRGIQGYPEGVFRFMYEGQETNRKHFIVNLGGRSTSLRHELSKDNDHVGHSNEKVGIGVIMGSRLLWTFDSGKHHSLCDPSDIEMALARISFARRDSFNPSGRIQIIAVRKTVVDVFVNFLAASATSPKTNFTACVTSSPPLEPILDTTIQYFNGLLGDYFKASLSDKINS